VAKRFGKWLCWSLVAVVALRSYFVQELTAALVLFTIGFFLIALLFFAAILLVNLFANAHARESSNRLLEDAPVLLAPRPGKMH
jgi:hypothetical protein